MSKPKPKSVVPKDFPKTKDLKRIVELGESFNARGLVQEIIKDNFRSIVYDVCSGLSAYDISVKYGFSERAFWYYLKAINVDMSTIQQYCKEEEEFKRMVKEEKLQKKVERLKIVPTTVEDLEKVLEWLNDLKLRIKPKTYSTYVKCYLDMIKVLGKHPSDIFKEDVENYFKLVMMEWVEKGKDLNKKNVRAEFSSVVVTPLRVFCEYQGIPLTPELKTTEYESPYRNVRLTVDERFKILEFIEKYYPKHFEWVKAVLFALYYNGHRAMELTTIKFEPRGRITLVYTVGKRSKEYHKVLRSDVYELIKDYLPLTARQLMTLRKILRNTYENVLDKKTITYMYAVKHPLHVWRHTACNDLIEYSNYNISLIMETLGWYNPSMITKIYGKATPETIARGLMWLREPRKPFEFFHSEYLEKAFEKGWVTKAYYDEVKRIEEILIREVENHIR